MDLGLVSSRAARRLTALLDGLQVVVQPIVEVATGRVLAVEALARFAHADGASPEQIIADAHRAGYGFAVEAACLRAALAMRSELPGDVLLTINVSPDGLHHPEILVSWPRELSGVVVEVTEQDSTSPSAFAEQVALLRGRGAAIAIDDVSSGYAGLLRLATLRPDFVKIDKRVVTGVRESLVQSAVLEALVNFSHRLGSPVIGEGVEDLDEIVTLAGFDVDYVQGWGVAHAAPHLEPLNPVVVQTCQASRERVLGRPATAGGLAAHTRDMHSVTAALARATALEELPPVIERAARELAVDMIAISTLRSEDRLVEVVNSTGEIDPTVYQLADYPATRAALATGITIEAHVGDARSDPAEQALLSQLGLASLLMVPVDLDGAPIGLLELGTRGPRRWSAHDIAHARGLAEHLAQALARLDPERVAEKPSEEMT